jgi:hypothetical protein
VCHAVLCLDEYRGDSRIRQKGTPMETLTKEQEQRAAAAADVSYKAFHEALKIKDEEPRLEAEADQAETYIRSIDALEIPHDHPLVADLVRQSQGNITRWENYTKGIPLDDRVEVPRERARRCFQPDCDYFGPPGTCRTHDQNT